ncbi:cytochrome P450 [Mycena olivaceomarginata]|nr:cytochrome P450 [Mycena olivaceomarginata]
MDLALGGVGLLLVIKLMKRRSTPPRPPGPRGLPFLENLLDMPTEREWIKFAEFGKLYGDISSVSVFGQQLTIINGVQVAMDILDKKSVLCSDRPVVTMGGELIGWKNTLVFVPYGPRFRNYRKLAHSLFGSTRTMASFLKRLLSKPEELQDQIRKTAGAVILGISHGYAVKQGVDPFVALADKATEQFSLASSPGRFLVTLIPANNLAPNHVPVLIV